MKQGKKNAKKLADRKASYKTTIAGDSAKTTQFTEPGSNKKSH